MRASVQKMRPRRKGSQSASGEASGRTPGSPDSPEPASSAAPGRTRNSPAGKPSYPDPAGAAGNAGRGRPAHVRTRLIVAVAVVAAAIAAAGAPSIVTASSDLNDSQNLVTLADQTKDALTLAHALADERDEVTSYIAAGRPDGEGPSERHSARVDRQVDELSTEEAPAELRKDLGEISSVRRAALTGESTALEAHQAYSAAIAELHGLAEDLAERLPPRAGSGAHALADLDTAVQQAAATRGLLLAALNVPTKTETVTDPATGETSREITSSTADTRTRNALSAAAQQANVREQAALADFHDAAPSTDSASYYSTVTGPDVTSAEKYLATLVDRATLSESELGTDPRKLDAALSARVEQMRGIEASLNSQRAKDLAQLRDDDVTALEIRIALLGFLMLIAVGVSTAMARTLTRPLAVLRLGSARLAADPASQEPVKFTGRDDEFAQVVRSVNALHAHAVALQERLTSLEGDRKHLIGQRQHMADERDKLRRELAEAASHLAQVRQSIHGTFVNLSLRTLGLVERQLSVIEQLEEREQDPDRLATLFRLDHLATVMRRHSENLLVLAGAEHGHQHPEPVPLVDVARAAVSEIERYERVRIAALPPHAHLAGFAADDISHLMAELMENATSFSPPDIPVEVSGWLLESGEIMLSVQDEGIGMTTDRLDQLNARLSDFDPEDAYDTYDQESGEGLGLGLYVVARLAHRHGVRVRLREQKQGGIAAVVVLPKSLLAAAPAVAVPSSTHPALGGARSLSFPGADSEANSNVLHGRSGQSGHSSGDPLIAAAEEAARDDTGADSDAGADSGTGTRDDEAAPADSETGAEGFVREEAASSALADSGTGAEGFVRDDAASLAPADSGTGAGDVVRDGAAPFALADSETGAEGFVRDDAASFAPADSGTGAGEAVRDDAAPFAPEAEAAPAESAQQAESARPAEDPERPETAEPSAPAQAWESAEPLVPAEPSESAEPPEQSGPPEPSAPETTMALIAIPAQAGNPDPYAIGPDSHERAHDDRFAHDRFADERVAGQQVAAAPVADEPERVTDKGLPKRTPKVNAPAPAARPRAASVDAEALRRRLGGFHRGAIEGRRDVEAELAEQQTARTAERERASEPVRERAAEVVETEGDNVQGDTVEEASS
ncbi:nitrate- and nitrite sensing domain-containing protein [Streptomyces ureilyticus]|nr:nitrate- and nitrite sensing domain-containing protein [Streptomyces ureilyticus]